MKFLHFVVLACTSIPFALAQSSGTGLLVSTAEGDVLGSSPVTGVRQWLGIPYASANRWEAPTAAPTRSSTLSATSFGDSCPQLISPTIHRYLEFAHQDEPLTESEDCLTVNIWAPSMPRPQNTAVLIYIPGGGFQFGTSALSVYNGQNMVKDNDDIIVVTFNYRLNILGQPNAPQLVSPTDSQNFGLLDQRAAIQWVYDNIAAFGGDPSRISIAGHSAGGTSAGLYALSYPTDTIVKGIIEQSGNVIGSTDLVSPTLDDAPWHTVADAVGCGNTATPAQFTCMQGKPWQDLVNAANAANIIFFKIVTDEILVFSDYEDRLEAGNLLQVPTMIGNVIHEANALTVGMNLQFRGNSPPFLTTVIGEISSFVGGVCATSREAALRFDAGIPTWRYRYEAIFHEITTRSDLGAFHGSDIPAVFGSYDFITSSPSTNLVQLSNYFQGAWVEFVKNPATGLTTYGWPEYDPSDDTLVRVGDRENLTGAFLYDPHLLDATCSDVSTLMTLNAQFNTLLAAI
ncbi:carboxylesterase [Coprinopsis cinerea okayama7|uniref:Carboxylic ester hydrolase n=1 Tax=Coprinopsis cinerea (strain Okayama-7 / 130 / ATCC MYA-4618 / FGSC 9003) TaxID=240176 RepID=A8NIW4_COPC7|nr:carboxylesterase [Coprinopsis cinerea okayama7\|eukprot:XP_001834086.1 carboxylesterase [Coprinopsis cinerea okayama7\